MDVASQTAPTAKRIRGQRANCAFCAYITLFFACASSAQVLTFDDLSARIGLHPPVPNGYGGLQWQNFELTAPLAVFSPPNGGQNGVVSPPNVIFNASGSNASFSASAQFNLNSGYFTAVWNDGLLLEVQGYSSGSKVYDHTYTLNTMAYRLITFDLVNVDDVVFAASGGAHHAGYSGFGTEFVLDNLSVSFVPEPCPPVLLALGIAVCLRRKLAFW
jgi:hypothetical protein